MGKAEKKTTKAPAKEKKAKGEKDPNAPKRPMGAYFLYAAAVREEFKKEYPGVGAAELSKKMGAAWKEMDPSEKEQYDDQAKKDKVRYEKEKEKYESGK